MDHLDTFILSEISKGNENAFEQLFFQYQPKIVAFLVGITHDLAVSRDLAQDVFLAVWKDREKLSQINSVSSYLYQIARFKVFDYFDHLAVNEKYIQDYLNQVDESYLAVEEIMFAHELQNLIEQTVSQMPLQRQRAYRLSRESGLSNEEIAVQLGVSKRTVENHITAALSTLRKVIYLWIILFKI